MIKCLIAMFDELKEVKYFKEEMYNLMNSH